MVWWVAGGLGLVGAGALAAALVTSPKNEAPSLPEAKPSRAAAAVCAACGTVESVKAEKHKGEGTGLGAVGGAVVGGVVGHQMGGGNGKKALTVLGAVGGGFAGHEVEKQVRSTTVYHVQMRMDDGSTRSVTQSAAPAVGARFEIQGNQLKPLAAKG
jgi:outer membrane lipoprotein SlyB